MCIYLGVFPNNTVTQITKPELTFYLAGQAIVFVWQQSRPSWVQDISMYEHFGTGLRNMFKHKAYLSIIRCPRQQMAPGL